MHLDEVAGFMDFSVVIAINAVRRNERCQANDPVGAEQLGYLADAPDILVAILGIEPKVAVETLPDVVAVQYAAAMTSLCEVFVHQKRHCRLARRAESGEPNRYSTLTEDRFPFCTSDLRHCIGDVLAFGAGHGVPFLFSHVLRSAGGRNAPALLTKEATAMP